MLDSEGMMSTEHGLTCKKYSALKLGQTLKLWYSQNLNGTIILSYQFLWERRTAISEIDTKTYNKFCLYSDPKRHWVRERADFLEDWPYSGLIIR